MSRCVLWSVAAWRFLPSRMGCNSKGRVVMGDLHRHYSVMQAGWNVVKCSYSECIVFFLWRERRASGRPLVMLAQQVEPRRPCHLTQSKPIKKQRRKGDSSTPPKEEGRKAVPCSLSPPPWVRLLSFGTSSADFKSKLLTLKLFT